jgi:GDP-4-dehydro-6-deoxy-D-mannose reductase
MEKYMITGFSGFVSKHFLDYLDSQGNDAEVAGLDINLPDFDYKGYDNLVCRFHNLNLLNREEVDSLIGEFQPDYILHLASFSSVAYSWEHPVESFTNNTNIFLNLLEQVRRIKLKCRILSVGSSEEYGNVAEVDIPLSESHPLRPISPYAVARVAQEMLSKVYVEGYGLDVILTRSFNHIGPGQKDIFVISSFVKRMVEIRQRGASPQISTGDLSIVRDFLDVRDVVKAYYLLLKKGEKGHIYNVCSGEGISLSTIISRLERVIGIKVETIQDPLLVRPSDNRIIIGNNSKIVSELDWKIQYTLDESLRDIYRYWECKLSSTN